MRRVALLLGMLLALVLPAQGWAVEFVFHDNGNSNSDSSSTTIASTAFAVTAGDLVVCGVGWEGTNTTISLGADLTLSTWVTATAKANSGSNGEPHVQIIYTLAAAGTNATDVVTVTLSGASTFRRLRCASITITAATTLDTEASGEATTGVDPVTGAFSTANAVEYVFTAADKFSAGTFSSLLVGGNTATVRGTNTNFTAFDYITASAISSGTAGFHDSGSSNRWTIVTAAFKQGAGAVIPKRGPLTGVYP